jgi:hypothetical protein
MFFKRFFASPAPKTVFSRDLPGDEPAALRAELRRCLDRDGGTLASHRRLERLVALFDDLSDAGKTAYAEAVATLNDAVAKSSGERYSRIEESEYFGRASTKMAILDTFEPARKRLLAMISEQPAGPSLLDRLRAIGPADMAAEIDGLAGEENRAERA